MIKTQTFALAALVAIPFALSTMAFADDTKALSNPELISLRSSLSDTNRFVKPRVELLLTKSVDATGQNVYGGSMAFVYHHASAPLNYAFSLTKVIGFSDDGKTVYFKGIGTMLNIESKKSMTCNVEFSLQDNQNSASKAGTPGDSFALHFWNEGSDFNFTSSWTAPNWQSVEIYRP